jgi:glycosyltransferase involved in cell wall biosynthesis
MRILYIRNHASKVNFDTYNLQEVGFSKALVNRGHDCDIIYFTDNKKPTTTNVYNNGSNSLNILWMNGITFKSNAIFLQVLKPKFLKKYDIIITTEYIQIMTFLLTFLAPSKLALYHGPYKDQDNKKFHKIFDRLFLKRIVHKIDKVFAKSELAKNYLLSKGFKDPKVLGVGLDISRFEEDLNDIDNEEREAINDINNRTKDKKVLLYIGLLEERRNITFIIDIFAKMLADDKNIALVLIGKGKKEDIEAYFNYAKSKGVYEYIIYKKAIKQKYLKLVYEKANVFLLPSSYEIFGMVLLEGMFLGVPIITSINGGSTTIIESGSNGYAIKDFDVEKWCLCIKQILYDDDKSKLIVKSAKKTIVENYTWKEIAKNFFNS